MQIHNYLTDWRIAAAENEGSGGGGDTPTAGAAPEVPAVPPEQAAGSDTVGTDTTPAGSAPEDQAWYIKRIAELTGQKGKKDEEIRTLREQVLSLQAKTTPAAGGAKTYSEDEIQAEVDRRAQLHAQAMDFNRKVDEVYYAGVKEFSDFQAKVDTLKASVEITAPFMFQALATGKAQEVIYKLGSDPALAQRIMAMEPNTRAVELAKIAMETKVREPSKAPAPGATRVGANGSNGNDQYPTSNDDMKTWMEKRERQLREREKARA